MQSVSEEVERCLPYFIRLCVNGVVASGARLDEAAIEVARELHGRLPFSVAKELKLHFEIALKELVNLVSALAPRLPPQLLRDFAQRASEAQVAATLARSLRGVLSPEIVSQPTSSSAND